MEFLQAVKERQSTTDAMFEPLQDIIELLRNYGVAIPEESVVQLQELPEKWANTKRLSVIAIQQVAPLQVTSITIAHKTRAFLKRIFGKKLGCKKQKPNLLKMIILEATIKKSYE